MEKAALEWERSNVPDPTENHAEQHPVDLRLLPGGASKPQETSPPAVAEPAPVLIDGATAALLKQLLTQQIAGNESNAIPLAVLQRVSHDWIFDMRYSSLLSEYTLASYSYSVSVLFKWMSQTGRESLSEADVRSFFEDLAESFKKPSPKSHASKSAPGTRMRNAHFLNLRVMFNWAVAKGMLTRSPLGKMSTPKYEEVHVQPFSVDEVRRLLAAAKTSPCGLRDYALILFMYDSGARANEVYQLLFSDLDFEECAVHIRHGKGNKQRTVRISPDTRTAIWRYLADSPRRPDDPLFSSTRGKGRGRHLTPSGLLQLYNRLGEKAGIEVTRCSPHTMRHAFASSYVNDGGAVEDLQKLLGHTKPTMSMRYVELSQEHLKRQHLRHSPVSKLLLNNSRTAKWRG